MLSLLDKYVFSEIIPLRVSLLPCLLLPHPSPSSPFLSDSVPVGQSGLKLTTQPRKLKYPLLLPSPPECCDYRHAFIIRPAPTSISNSALSI